MTASFAIDSLTKRGENSWRLSYHSVSEDGVRGKRLYKTFSGCSGKREARARAQSFLAELAAKAPSSGGPTIAALLEEEMARLLSTRAIEDSTYRGYAEGIKRLEWLGKGEIGGTALSKRESLDSLHGRSVRDWRRRRLLPRPAPDGQGFARLTTAVVLVGGECRFHWLRRTFTATMIAAGVDVRTMSTWFGHPDPSTTLKLYVDLDETAMTGSVDVLGKALPSGGADCSFERTFRSKPPGCRIVSFYEVSGRIVRESGRKA